MVKFYLFSFVFFIASCGDFKKDGTFKTDSFFMNEMKKKGFSKATEEELARSYGKLKTFSSGLNLGNLSEAEEKQIIAFKLGINEIYEKALYKKSLQHRDISEVTHKYKILREAGIKKSTSVPDPLVLEAVLHAYKDFGRLYISESPIKANGKLRYSKIGAKKMPWSGYWYSFKNSVLYKNEYSPLGKFDTIVEAITGIPSNAREWHQKNTKGFDGTSWNGLCNAWSLAALLTEEPLVKNPEEQDPKKKISEDPIVLGGVTFERKDIKALLTYAHLKYPVTQYGLSYRGGLNTDGAHQDINPEAFHTVIQDVLGRQERGVVVDVMSGPQVWNSPLFEYIYKVVQDPENENAFLVTAFPNFIKYRGKETNELTTRENDVNSQTFNYRLYVDKRKKNREGKYLVLSGEWVGSSIKSHPDNIKVPDIGGSPSSLNPEFNKYFELLKPLYKKIP